MAIVHLRGRNLYKLMQFICGVSFMMYGYDAGVLGGLISHKPFLKTIGNPTSEQTIPWITSAYSLAACVTCPIVATFSFKIGRRGTIIMGNLVAILGAIIQCTSYTLAQLVVGRICNGFAIGAISSTVPAYLVENGIEVHDRGPAGALNAILLIGGIPIAYWIDYGCTKSDGQWSWRVPIALQCIFAITAATCMYFLPDTPRYYYASGKHAEGDRVLAQLNDLALDDPKVQQTKREILVAIEKEDEARSSLDWKLFLTSGIVDHTPLKIIRRLCICFWLPIFREWMGSSLMAYFSAVIIASTGAKPSLVSLLSGILNICYTLGCIPLYFTIERTGRRTTLLYGACALFTLMLIFLVLQAVPQTTAIQWAAIGIIFTFIFVFGYAWQGSMWLYSAEIAPLEYRHIGGAVTGTGVWFMTWLTVYVGPIGLDNVGWRFWFWVLSGNLCAIPFVYFCCPETGGKTLEQVDFLFSRWAFAPKMSKLDLEKDEELAKGGGSHIEMKEEECRP